MKYLQLNTLETVLRIVLYGMGTYFLYQVIRVLQWYERYLGWLSFGG